MSFCFSERIQQFGDFMNIGFSILDLKEKFENGLITKQEFDSLVEIRTKQFNIKVKKIIEDAEKNGEIINL